MARPATQWIDIELPVLKEVLDAIGGDGWSILPIEYYEKLGIPKKLISFMEVTHKSNPSDYKLHKEGKACSGKGLIFVKGEVVEELKGIRTLDVLSLMSRELPTDEEAMELEGRMSGRGSRASALADAIRKGLWPEADKADKVKESVED